MYYVIGDLHGYYTDFMKLIKKLNLTPEDKVILVGDILDRAPTTAEQKALIEWCYENITNDGQFQMVLGNHELRFIEDFQHILDYNIDVWGGEMSETDMVEMLRNNGNHINLVDIFLRFGMSSKVLYSWCKKLPLFKELNINRKKYFITHSWLCIGKTLSGIEGYLQGELTAEDFDITSSVWDRYCSVRKAPSDYTVIHGHTPTNLGDYPEDSAGYVHVQDGNINVDCGRFCKLPNYGNLAAYCIETGEATYLFDRDWYREKADIVCKGNYRIACVYYDYFLGEEPDRDRYTEDNDVDPQEFLTMLKEGHPRDTISYMDFTEFLCEELENIEWNDFVRYDFT